MNRYKTKLVWVGLLALLLILGGCKGESPTAPPPGGPTPPPGTPPPAGVTIVVTASNPDPLVDSTVLITATVTDNGTPVPNGTAVEFSTNNGTFTDTQASTTIRTTTNGVATATLTSSVAGASRTTVVVNNVSRNVDVTFRARPVTTPPPNTTPTITSVTPSVGRPAGGETIRITGRNFTGPVRVLFDVGTGTPVEGFVVNRTDTTIDVITPAVNLGAGQELISRIVVITAAGSTTEQRAEIAAGFTFRNVSLTPVVSTATPNSGPVTGGTRVSILGEGFQAPVQVLFGAAEARIIEVRFNEIIVEAPPGRDTSPNGSGPITGPVGITVVNINSQTRTTFDAGFRYVAAVQVIAAGPTEGPFTGGTRVTIDGNGFVAPVAVSIGGVAAQPIDVSGTRIIAITSPLRVTSCADATGPIVVTNISNGDQAVGPAFTYIVPRPTILSVNPGAEGLVPGASVTVSVANAFPPGRFTIGSTTLPVTGTTVNGDGTTTFQVTIPTNVELTRQACPGGAGERQVATAVSILYTSLTTTCTDTLGITVNPLPGPVLSVTPRTLTIVARTGDPTTTPPTPPQQGTGLVTIANLGNQPMTFTSAVATPPFVATGPAPGTVINPCDTVAVVVTMPPQAPGSTVAGQLTINTSAGTSTVSLIGQTQ